jgi:hypothetical protein
MCVSFRSLSTLLLGLAGVLSPSPALAWVESTVLSDTVTVDVESAGDATVAHELVMRVRGGPLKSTELSGVDSDAEPMEGAIALPLQGNRTEPVALTVSRGDDDTLRMEVSGDKGLRNGTYAFKFSYKTSFKRPSRVELRGSWAEIDWIGPRYTFGLDVAKVTFRLPNAPLAPRLPELDLGADESIAGLPSSAMLSNLRRNGSVDELELIRPHVAKGEPVLWRVWVSPSALPWLSSSTLAARTPSLNEAPGSQSPLAKGLPLLVAGGIAVFFAFLIWAKSRQSTREVERQGSTLLPLWSVSVWWQALGGGITAAAAVLLAVRFETPTLAAIMWTGALSFAVNRRPKESRKLRGPGRWLPIVDEEAWQKSRMAAYGRALDASTLLGRATLSVWLLSTLSLAFWCFSRDPYYALLIALGSTLALPVWLTGCFSDMPWARADRARLGLRRLAKSLTRHAGWKIRVIGRFPQQATEPDEVRLRITGPTVPSGLQGLEVAVSCDDSRLGVEYALLVRVTDGSFAHRLYANRLEFGRGRATTERVAVVRFPWAPVPRLRSLVEELLEIDPVQPLDRESSSPRSNKPERSKGKGSVTSKPSRKDSPVQATRAA